ncbi:RNA-binding protein Cwf29 [Dimargaris cristalligena]|uniref:RRM domain-containing protein n=1 Tax=Dimargaris cristalligena TaxID=215637 RepID=A0A4Q0A0U6_9FUNG|nr:RNA-binding protein Cwf29 [Dimargaris cristalligena]RKP39637.1 hypothetical protein BJ085DRAFT_36653 [Dimargaris cristalligena]|eukprot:RKP39637.1 hypothetical protein BJ085DRAFT_36653 [Dimargaris cristalligena]
MNVVKEIQRLNQREAERNLADSSSSWHYEYRDSAYIFIGGLDYELTEGDVLCVFSQYGEILDINLVRDRETGRSKGYAFLMYEDQRSTVLAVDNLNGAKVAGRTLRVDHVRDYRPPKDAQNQAEGDQDLPLGPTMNAAPPLLEVSDTESPEEEHERLLNEHGIDVEDPMADYYLQKLKKQARNEQKKAHKDQGTKKHKRKDKESATKK